MFAGYGQMLAAVALVLAFGAAAAGQSLRAMRASQFQLPLCALAHG